MESLLGLDDTEVDFRRILEEARDVKGCATFETFSTVGPSEFLVASRSRWDQHQKRPNAPWRQKSSASSSEGHWQEGLEEQRVGWSSRWKDRIMEAVEDYLENCANMKVDIEVLERLMEPENRETSLRYILKYSMRGGSFIFQLFDTSEKQDHFVWGKNGAQQESGQNEWHDIEYQGEMAKAPLCPERTLKTPLPQQSSLSSREEEVYWVAMEDRRRRSIAFKKVAKRMLRYPDNSDDVKVGITELQERLEISEKSVFHSASGPASDERKRPNIFCSVQARRRRKTYCQFGHLERTVGRSGGIGKKVSNYDAGSTSIE